MGDSGAHALAALKEAPSLHTLTLYLGGNSVGASGAQALAALKEAPSLHTLHTLIQKLCMQDLREVCKVGATWVGGVTWAAGAPGSLGAPMVQLAVAR